MTELRNAFLFFGLFALRCLVPLAITLAAGYVLVRLDERWRKAAAAERQAWIEAEETGKIELPRSPALPSTPLLSTAPCWVLKQCDPAVRAECPAYQNPNGPCWLTRMKTEGELPASCLTCTLFTRDVREHPLLARETEANSWFTQPAGQA